MVKRIRVDRISIGRRRKNASTVKEIVARHQPRRSLRLSPIKVVQTSRGWYKLLDGQARVLAYRELGLKFITAWVYNESS